MRKPLESDYFIHESAWIEPEVLIGDGTSIWHGCQVRTGATIGSKCVIGKNCMIDAGVSVGDGVKIQNNVSVYAGVTIGNEVFVGPSAVFTNDLVPRAHNVTWRISSTLVNDGASIGANATIVCGISVGKNSMVGAGSVVTRDVPDHALVVGSPARIVGWVCRCGVCVSRSVESPENLTCESCLTEIEATS